MLQKYYHDYHLEYKVWNFDVNIVLIHPVAQFEKHEVQDKNVRSALLWLKKVSPDFEKIEISL